MENENLKKEVKKKASKHERSPKDEKSISVTKEVLVSALIILFSNIAIYFYPLYMNYTKYQNYFNSIYSNGNNPVMDYAKAVGTSTLDAQTRKDAFNIINTSNLIIAEKSVLNYQTLLYFFTIATVALFASSLAVLKNHKDEKDNKRYIGVALFIAAIVSLVVCVLFGAYGYFIDITNAQSIL